MKRIKQILPIIIAFIIGISTTVGAVTVFNSKNITYSSSATSKKNVKEALDELYLKAVNVEQCPSDYHCLTGNFANILEVGNYIKMIPTSTSYSMSAGPSGTYNQDTINPSELDLWRVIRKNADGTIDVVSEYVSSGNVAFAEEQGYQSLVGLLNHASSSYMKMKSMSKVQGIWDIVNRILPALDLSLP